MSALLSLNLFALAKYLGAILIFLSYILNTDLFTKSYFFF